MSCWVVPAIAAELWGVPVGHVLSRIREGSVGSREEHGFVFVDVAPESHTYRRPRRADEPAPATFVDLNPSDDTQQEFDAVAQDAEEHFLGHLDIDALRGETAPLAISRPSSDADDELPPLDEEEDSTPLPPRDAVRAAVARQRHRPLAA